ncbi:phage major capsid protein [Bosea minatitlanensis]|uniref:Phage major capsid protein n=1 Tax=Bosea minatitlanensis TaxID=128782 RepID=A0ABW0F2I3_9HYPH|nr:phage major capsid protein [Bosea minatitlanensis]MCT4492719.1 phage major capsid protein [Bosea minatitlanensis]
MNLEQLRAQLREKHGALAPLREKAMADGAPKPDFDAYEQAVKDLEAIEAKIALLERDEAIEAKASKPANAPVSGEKDTVPAVPQIKIEPAQKIGLIAAANIKAKDLGEPALKVLEDEGYGEFAKELDAGAKRMGKKTVQVGSSADGGILVPTTLQSEIIELLRPEVTFLQGGPRRVQFVGGKFKQPRGATGATAGYVGEMDKKPISSPTFEAIDMSAKKLAGIVPLTLEAKMWTVGNIEAYVRDDLRMAMGQTMDLNAYFGTGTGDAPLGILNKPGIGSYDASGFAVNPLAPTIAEIDRMASKLVLHLTLANIGQAQSWKWLMNYRTLEYLKNIRVGDNDGEFAYPSLQGASPTWKGFGVLVTNQVPINGGGTTDETTIALIDFRHVLYGDEGSMIVKSSDVATMDMGGGTLVHALQQNVMFILMETFHDFGLRLSQAVAKLTKVRWGADLDDVTA